MLLGKDREWDRKMRRESVSRAQERLHRLRQVVLLLQSLGVPAAHRRLETGLCPAEPSAAVGDSSGCQSWVPAV